jgi:hypothetical protein
MQNGVSVWRAAGFLGMSVEILDRVYGHHHPDFLSDAAAAMGRKPNQALVVSLVEAAARRENRTSETAKGRFRRGGPRRGLPYASRAGSVEMRR